MLSAAQTACSHVPFSQLFCTGFSVESVLRIVALDGLKQAGLRAARGSGAQRLLR